jgi:RecB family exonuclease
LAATEWESARIDGLTTSPSFAGSLLTTGSPACEQEWRTQAASAGVVLDDAVVDAAQDLLTNRGSGRFTRFDGNLTHVADGLPDFADGVRSVAPTALEQYVDCPHSYFIRRLLRIEPVEQPEDLLDISPADLGTLMHEAFDGLVKEYAGRLPGHGEPWSDEQRQRLAEIAADLAQRFTDEGRTGHPRLWQRTLARIQADLQAMLSADDVWRAEHRARVVTSELHFGVDGTEPVAIRLPDGTTVLMRGSADKVDVGEDGTLFVTDIKSGSSKKFTGLGPDDPLLGGSKLQLPVYAHAARAAHGDEDTVVEASYWFVGRHKDRMAVPLNDDVEELYAETVQTIVSAIRSGLFPARPPRDADVTYVQCRYCNPDGIGYGTGRARWESVRHDPRLSALVALVEPLPSTDDGADA